MLSRFPILEIDLTAARAGLWSDLAAKGQMIGVHDSWVAATCIAHDLRMITANLREFEHVPGLQAERTSSP